MNDQSPLKIVVVGGGTAGWLTASILNRRLGKSADITVVESPNIPTIGVGEATIPSLTKTLYDLDINEQSFLEVADATFKHGILFNKWATGKDGDYYYHTFEQFAGEGIKHTDVHEGGGLLTGSTSPDLGLAWLASTDSCAPSSYAYHVGVQPYLCDRMLAPKGATTRQFQGLVPYAYHLDAARFGAFLTSIAVARGVHKRSADVLDWSFDESGNVESLLLSDNSSLPAEIFIDCTGFRALLIGKALDTPFVSYGEHLLSDRAVVAQIPHNPGITPRPYTTASAMPGGWIWQIDTRSRQGTGYVYSSQFVSDDAAHHALKQFHDRNTLEPRVIKFASGRRQESWRKNVIAVGLSGGFLEPLESTGIFLIERSADLLAECLPQWREWNASEAFNDKMRFLYEEIRDFLVLHYYVSSRTDSDFWKEVRSAHRAPRSLREKLEQWNVRPPRTFETSDRWRCFSSTSYRAVLWGMGRIPQPETPAIEDAKASRMYMAWAADRISDQALPHQSCVVAPGPSKTTADAFMDSRLTLDLPKGTTIQVCTGSRSASDDEKRSLELEHSALIPNGDWSPCSSSTLADWFASEVDSPGLCISVVELPDPLGSAFKLLGEQVLAENSAQSPAQAARVKRAVLELLGGVVEAYGDPHSVTKPLGVGQNAPGLAVTTRGSAVRRIGLHVDNWTKEHSLDRRQAENRICINIGRSSRQLLFLPVPLSAISERLQSDAARKAISLGPTDIARLYMRQYPTTPIFSVGVKPGQAYIAPTENIVHDGSTAGASDTDLFVTYLGRFASGRARIPSRSS